MLSKSDKVLVAWLEEVVKDSKAVTPKAKQLLLSEALILIKKLAGE